MEFAIKVRRKGSKAWWFLSGNGMNRLLIHASRFGCRENAELVCRESAPLNPDYEWKVVEL